MRERNALPPAEAAARWKRPTGDAAVRAAQPRNGMEVRAAPRKGALVVVPQRKLHVPPGAPAGPPLARADRKRRKHAAKG